MPAYLLASLAVLLALVLLVSWRVTALTWWRTRREREQRLPAPFISVRRRRS